MAYVVHPSRHMALELSKENDGGMTAAEVFASYESVPNAAPLWTVGGAVTVYHSDAIPWLSTDSCGEGRA